MFAYFGALCVHCVYLAMPISGTFIIIFALFAFIYICIYKLLVYTINDTGSVKAFFCFFVFFNDSTLCMFTYIKVVLVIL